MKNQSSIVLKITILKQIRSLFAFLLFSFGLLFGCFYFFKNVNIYNAPTELNVIMGFVATFLAFITLPALFFHIDYLIRNRKQEYEIGNGKITIRKQQKEIVYHFEEVEAIYLYLSPPTFRNDFYFFAYDHYHFAKIIMKSSEELYLTSLLYPKGIEDVIKKYFTGIPYYRMKRLFCTTRYKSRHEKNEEDEKDYYGLFKDEKK